MPPRKASAKGIAVSTLAERAAKLKLTIQFGCEKFKDGKIEAELKKITAFFQTIGESKERSEFLKEFEKQEKVLMRKVEKLRDQQESLSKYEKMLEEKLTSKIQSLKAPDADDLDYANYKKQIDEAISDIRKIIEATKRVLTTLNESAEVALKLRASLKPEFEGISLAKAVKGCEKQAEKLSDRLDSICEISGRLSLSPGSAPAAQLRASVMLPAFDRSKALIAASERNVGSLLSARAGEGAGVALRLIAGAAGDRPA